MLQIGDVAPDTIARDVEGRPFSVAEYTGRPLVLSFFRYASCPMCLLRIAELAGWTPDLRAAGVEVVAVFHSPAQRILSHTRRLNLPMRLVADPDRALYAAFGVGRSWAGLGLSFLRPEFLWDYLRATVRGHIGGFVDGEFARMPADFVIGHDGRIAAAHYGRTIGDHMPRSVLERAVRTVVDSVARVP